jgi:hypothetical protein
VSATRNRPNLKFGTQLAHWQLEMIRFTCAPQTVQLMGRKGSRRRFADYEVRVSSRPLSCDAPRERHRLAHIGHRTPTG